ncbi:MAG: hypothetical protein ABIJ21_09235 [Nanoarchaeota archaeon]
MIGTISLAAILGCAKDKESSPENFLNKSLSVPYKGERMHMYDNDCDCHIDWIVGEGIEFKEGRIQSRMRSYQLSDSSQYWADQVNTAQAHLIYWLDKDREGSKK